MFERGKKDDEMGPTASRPSETPGMAYGGGGASGRSGSSGQFAVIGRSIQINGDVKGDEDLVIEGDVSGTVQLKNNSVTVGKEGSVKADICARAITVEGTTEGDLIAAERIAVRATANVRGNLLAPRISLEDGARFKGSVEMDTQAVEKALGTSAPQSKAASSRPEPVASNGNAKPAAASAN